MEQPAAVGQAHSKGCGFRTVSKYPPSGSQAKQSFAIDCFRFLYETKFSPPASPCAALNRFPNFICYVVRIEAAQVCEAPARAYDAARTHQQPSSMKPGKSAMATEEPMFYKCTVSVFLRFRCRQRSVEEACDTLSQNAAQQGDERAKRVRLRRCPSRP